MKTNKKTVANLDYEEMTAVQAGWAVTDRTYCTCKVLNCPTVEPPTDIC